MSRLLEDLLATARTRSAAFLDREVDLTAVARDAAEQYRVLAGERGIRLDLRLHFGPIVYADTESLDRALSNLLGLAIARQIVESHEGRLALFSQVDVGSSFVIWLPDRAMARSVPDRPRGRPSAGRCAEGHSGRALCGSVSLVHSGSVR